MYIGASYRTRLVCREEFCMNDPPAHEHEEIFAKNCGMRMQENCGAARQRSGEELL